MENQIMYLKKVRSEIIAEELLKEKAPFEKILRETGWAIMQLWDYIDAKFRKKYPMEYNNDIEYYCMGKTNSKQKKYTYATIR